MPWRLDDDEPAPPAYVSLADWVAANDEPHDEAFARFLALPHLPAAAQRLSQNMLALAAKDPALDGVVKDIGRFAATGLALYLHSSGGITLPRLKEVCRAMGFISPGRARAILLYLRFLRYVVPAQARESRVAVYEPTAELQAAWLTLMRGVLDAVQLFEPRIAVLSNRLGDPAIVRLYTRFEGEFALSRVGLGETGNAQWRVFLNRHAGTQVLHALMLAAKGDDYPPSGPIPFSLSQLAKEFRVSRPHVTRMLKAGEREGLLTFVDQNTLRFTDAGRAAAMHALALRLCGSVYAAARLHEELESGGDLAN